eukprot:g4496.t1
MMASALTHLKVKRQHEEINILLGLPRDARLIAPSKKEDNFVNSCSDGHILVLLQRECGGSKAVTALSHGVTQFSLRAQDLLVYCPGGNGNPPFDSHLIQDEDGDVAHEPQENSAPPWFQGQPVTRCSPASLGFSVSFSACARRLKFHHNGELQVRRLDRILPSRMLRKHKHAEQPGEAPTRKSRLCIRGDKDPDLLLLDRYSPTVTTLNVSVLLQIAANKRYPIALGDLKNAFCQSAPLNRETGEIYFEIPADGLEGVDKRQLILIVNGCYGLVDAPLHWRRSLVSTLQEFGYVQSRMDPCLFKLHQNGQLAGMVAIEVDDLLTAGNHFHEEKMMKLREIYQFGKWVELQKADNGASFNGRRLQQLPDYTIKIDMKKFVEERLNQIVLPTARKKMKESEVTEEERKQARMVCGALNWLSKEGRPDASAAASLCSSKINKMKADDILMMNEAVKEIKENSGLEIRIQPLSRMRFAVVTDASFGNSDFHSQAGQMIISHEVGLREGKKVPANLLWWRSGKLQRVVNLTLAAEAQSLSKGLGDLTWALVLFRELQEEKMSLRDWASNLRHDEILALASAQSDEQLRGCLAIVGAESLFDYLSRETIGGQDRRTAIEVQIPDHKGRLI